VPRARPPLLGIGFPGDDDAQEEDSAASVRWRLAQDGAHSILRVVVALSAC
jgi:hypothetical protein